MFVASPFPPVQLLNLAPYTASSITQFSKRTFDTVEYAPPLPRDPMDKPCELNPQYPFLATMFFAPETTETQSSPLTPQ